MSGRAAPLSLSAMGGAKNDKQQQQQVKDEPASPNGAKTAAKLKSMGKAKQATRKPANTSSSKGLTVEERLTARVNRVLQ